MLNEIICVAFCAGAFFGAAVRVSEETIVLPTYSTQQPDRNPLFFRPEEVQLAEKHVYPYPFYDVQTAEKQDREYKAIILENEYLKICVTPEMGGRLYYALDKTNGYEIVYNNRVVKPALIGTIGAWTSGGVEWNTPHHHRATSLIDVDYRVTENGDGSVTVWVGEYEKRSQTRWLTGMTLAPGKAYVRIDFRSMNVTPFQYPALYFANVAVHVNDNYQFIFPPDVEMMNFHYVTEFTRWPVLNQVYQSVDYTQGEDLSWWNATKQPVSFFVTKTSQDFMGGIDHGRQAGIALIGDHRIFKGKKLWNWGKNEVQEVWDQKLTDDDGPYAELMMGFYSDNQPDYNVVAPFETKYGTMYLYGVKGLGGIKEADRDFAVNLEVKEGGARVEVNATAEQRDITVQITCKGAVIHEEQADISPIAPYVRTVSLPAAATLEDLRIVLLTSAGAERMTWQKQSSLNEPFPEPYADPLDPREYTTAQDLYYVGLKLEQYGNTNFDYMKYYEAALRLDPDHEPTNTQLGTVYLKRREYGKAEAHLRKAVDIVTGNHTKAQDAAPLYYLGVCLMKQGDIGGALDMLYRATWAYPWTSAGYTLIARLEGARGDWDRAVDAAERAYRANTQNVEALTAKAVALRLQGAHAEALHAVQEALMVDPLCFVALNEQRLLAAEAEDSAEAGTLTALLVRLMRDETYNYIETAARYRDFGLYEDAAAVMRLASESDIPGLSAHPMIHYHLAFYLAKTGRDAEADALLKTASGLSLDYCFPYGDASVEALRFAVSRNAGDAAACYLLGNALADYQHEEAVRWWEEAARHTPDASILYRNMAYLQANHLHDMPAALDNIMKAISLNPAEPRYFTEADLYMSYASLTPEQLSAFLAEYGNMAADITDIQLMRIKLDIYNGDYDGAIRQLETMRYHIEEGATFNPHVHWFDAHLHKGIRLMHAGDHDGAEACFLRSMEFPANLEAERNSKTGIALYYLGVNRKRSGDAAQAAEWFGKMAAYTPSQGWGAGDFPELDYFKALALRELGGNDADAEGMFKKLISDGERRVNPVKDSRHITVTVEEAHSGRTFLLEKELARKGLRVSAYYMQGLGRLGLGDRDKARAFFAQAIELDPLAIDPKVMLESMQ